MMMKGFRSGQGGGAGPTEYLLKETDLEGNEREIRPGVLRGDPERTAAIIDSLDFEWRYTSGVISFAREDEPTEEEQERLMDDFERLAFAGLERDQYDILWVRHAHLDRVELHFVTPRVDLRSGKSLNIMPPGWDRQYNVLRDLWNEREGWADPRDPARARTWKAPSHEMKQRAEDVRKGVEAEGFQEAVTGFLEQRIEVGAVRDRAGVVRTLEEIGVKVVREGRESVTVENPDDRKKYVMRGAIYDEGFRAEQFYGTAEGTDGAGAERNREPDPGRIAELESALERIIERRADRHRERYGEPVSRGGAGAARERDTGRDRPGVGGGTQEDRGLAFGNHQSRRGLQAVAAGEPDDVAEDSRDRPRNLGDLLRDRVGRHDVALDGDSDFAKRARGTEGGDRGAEADVGGVQDRDVGSRASRGRAWPFRGVAGGGGDRSDLDRGRTPGGAVLDSGGEIETGSAVGETWSLGAWDESPRRRRAGLLERFFKILEEAKPDDGTGTAVERGFGESEPEVRSGHEAAGGAQRAIDEAIERTRAAMEDGRRRAGSFRDGADRRLGEAGEGVERASRAVREDFGRGVAALTRRLAEDLDQLDWEVNPVTLARKFGYEPDPNVTGRKYLVLDREKQGGQSEEIWIVMEPDGSGRFLRSNGTVETAREFAGKETDGTPKAVRQALWASLAPATPADKAWLPPVCEPERKAAIVTYLAEWNPSFDERGWMADHSLKAGVVREDRFEGRWDERRGSGQMFLFRDEFGISGVDLLRDGRTTSIGLPGIWKTSNVDTSSRLVFVSSPVEAMSHAQVTGESGTAYVCTNGTNWTVQQAEELIRMATQAAEQGKLVANAVTNNPELSQRVEQEVLTNVGDENSQTVIPRGADSWNTLADRGVRQEVKLKLEAERHEREKHSDGWKFSF